MKRKLTFLMIAIVAIFAFSDLNLSSAFAQQCGAPSKVTELNINNIRALFKNNGSHFCMGNANLFEVPKGSGKTSFFAASLWMGGVTESGNLHLAAMLYGKDGNDYYPGPLSISPESATYYDKFWSISKAEIDYHKAHYADLNYIMPDNISTWPAHGNPMYGESANLAPYVSVSGNSTYTPSQGDYPLIRGDQALFWINNDACPHGESGSINSLGVEILNMAYAYNRPEYELQHTIFISHQIRNKSPRNYYDFYLSFFVDFDIGYADDDYIGCDTLLNLAYGYNGKEIDDNGSGHPNAYGAHPPAQGAMFLNQKMNTFMYVSKYSQGPMGPPNNSIEYYNYMRARWRNGIPLTYGRNGYETSGEITRFMFSGDPVTKTGWTEITPDGPGSIPNVPYDKRGVMSAEPFTLLAGESICIDIALPFAQDIEGDNIASVAMLKQKAQAIQLFYDSQDYSSSCAFNVGIQELRPKSGELKIYPNPTTGELRIENGEFKIENVEIFDIYGRTLLSLPSLKSFETTLNISHLPTGLYFVKITTEKGEMIKKIVKE